MKPLLFHRIVQQRCGRVNYLVFVRRLMSQLADVRQHLQQLKAGTVELTKNTNTGIAVLTLNNPDSKNALSGSMMVELADHVTDLSQWQEGKGLILHGANDTFCSGGDLKVIMGGLGKQEAADMSLLMHDTLTRLSSLPLVSLALIQGVAIGGGAELAVACDVRVMTAGARVGFVQVKMGLTTGWGATTHLVRLLGRPRTLHLLGSGKVLTAPEALGLGLVTHCLPDDPPVLQAAHTLLLDNYCWGPAPLVRGVKEMVREVESSGSVAEGLALERKVFTSFWKEEAHQTALKRNAKHS